MAALRAHRGKSSDCLQADSVQATALRCQCANAKINSPVADARSGLAIRVMTQEAVPDDLYTLDTPLSRLPRLGIMIALRKVKAFADHIRHVLPTLWYADMIVIEEQYGR